MEHAKKMILVDPKMYRPTMRDKTLSRLDNEITETLNSDINDDEKARKYMLAIKRYKHFESPPETTTNEVDESSLLNSFPITNRHQAKRMLDGFKKQGDLKIAKDGSIVYKQQHFPASNITELLDVALHKKPKAETQIIVPNALPEFIEGIKTAKLPKDVIANDTLWKHMYPTQQQEIGRKRRKEPKYDFTDYKNEPSAMVARVGKRGDRPRWTPLK